MIGFDSIASFRYELAVGGEALTSEEVAQLAELKAPMVRLRGQWIELDPRRLAAGLKLAGQTGQARVGELIGSDWASMRHRRPAVAEVEADGWLGELLSGRVEHSVAAVDTPDSFHGQLRPTKPAVSAGWTSSGAGLGVLADDMGLGKTVQLLALLAYEQNGGPPSLLVCPMSLVGNWQREAARFTPGCECTSIMAPSGPAEVTSAKRLPAAILWSPRMHLPRGTPPISARSPGGASSSTKRRRSRTPPPSRPPRSARSRRALGLPSPERRWKPPRRPVVHPRVRQSRAARSAAAFKKRYAEPIERRGDDDAADRLRRFTGPFILRRVKTDTSIIADLPEKLEMDLVCNLTASRPRCIRRWSTTCWTASAQRKESSAAAWCWPR